MERKWTPKPWKVGYGGREGDGYATMISPHRTAPLAEMVTWSDINENEMMANVNLMISAPDLYEALDGMLNRYTTLVNSGDAGFWNPETDAEVIAARAALARARGEA